MPKKQTVSSAFIRETVWLLNQVLFDNTMIIYRAITEDAEVMLVLDDWHFAQSIGRVSEIARIDPRIATAVTAIQSLHRINAVVGVLDVPEPWRVKMALAYASLQRFERRPTFRSIKASFGITGRILDGRRPTLQYHSASQPGKTPRLEVHCVI